jgi:hypothetical protein
MTSNLSSIYTDQYSGTLGVTVAQALLQGGGIGANLARLRQARLDVERISRGAQSDSRKSGSGC